MFRTCNLTTEDLGSIGFPKKCIFEEKDRLSAEFITMCLNASTIASDLSERLNIKDHALAHSVWCQLLTNEQYYKSCQQVNNFALRFLNRSMRLLLGWRFQI